MFPLTTHRCPQMRFYKFWDLIVGTDQPASTATFHCGYPISTHVSQWSWPYHFDVSCTICHTTMLHKRLMYLHGISYHGQFYDGWWRSSLINKQSPLNYALLNFNKRDDFMIDAPKTIDDGKLKWLILFWGERRDVCVREHECTREGGIQNPLQVLCNCRETS